MPDVRAPARTLERRDTAELAVTVVDSWQGRGVGTILLQALCARASEEGVTRFTALMLAENDEMMDLLRDLGPVRVVDREADTVEVEVPNPAAGVAHPLKRLIHFAAEHDVAVPLAWRSAPYD